MRYERKNCSEFIETYQHNLRGDFAELAHLLLKIEDAKHKGTNTTSRHTVKGVIGQYSLLTRMDYNQVMAKIAKYQLPLGAIVEYDENIK